MLEKMRKDVEEIINYSIEKVKPESAVKNELKRLKLERVFVVSIGKAAWRMAKAAQEVLGEKIVKGIVITKYNHSEGNIKKFDIYEAGHPLPDENTIFATEKVLEMVKDLKENDVVLFLVSGGGSALFEKPVEGVSLNEVIDITDRLMKAGANIHELNTVRKHLSQVKGGRFAEKIYPTKMIVLVLSDVIGDRLDMIASGPAFPDMTTSKEALEILKKYKVNYGENIKKAILIETPKKIENAEHIIIGNVNKVCQAAASRAQEIGYNPMIFTTQLEGEAKEAAKFIASIVKETIKYNRPIGKPCALIFGGETVVQVKGKGKGGRNQEMALAFSIEIRDLENSVVGAFVGTDGTDGPTDAAGGIVDNKTFDRMKNKGINPLLYLENNDSYNALKFSGDLLITGPTGTNVNDLAVILVM